MRAFIFPGQGAQTVGMLAPWLTEPVAAALFQQLPAAIYHSAMHGPDEVLRQTTHAQPALYAVGYAAYAAYRAAGGAPAALVAGHSLGEYTALAAAEVVSFADGLRLVQARATAMANAAPDGGTMAAVLGLTAEVVQACCDAHGAVIANDNCPGQIVIAGTVTAVHGAAEAAKAAGARRIIALPVAGPFHSPLMAPAVAPLAAALAETTFHTPVCPVVLNTTAAPTQDPALIKTELLKQLVGQVRWRESLLTLAALGVTAVVECGTGKVLTGLVNKTAPQIRTHALTNPTEMATLLTAAVTPVTATTVE